MRWLATALFIFLSCCAHDQTIARYQSAVAANPNSFEAHYNLGLAYARGAQTASIFSRLSLANNAKDEFARAVELNPHHADARMRLIEFCRDAPLIVSAPCKGLSHHGSR
ncbi:MAG TPA: tetratricopeptide repeat protein [Thermoanaerobaculia bacterium]|nr:tetratricopeptide repeat protein [Thermoanaerobaculia bacterium]